MFQKNDHIIYKRETCKVTDILKKYLNNQDYYILTPIKDPSLKIKIPVQNKDIRPLITKEEVNLIIEKIPTIEVVKTDTKSLESTYKELLSTNKHEDLIKIIKTTYLRNKERLDNNKKTTDKDNYYFNLAENYLYQEFQIILNLTYEETKEYVISKVNELSSN